MTEVFIQQAILTYPGHPLHNQVVDIWVNQGQIAAIANQLTPPANCPVITAEGLRVSPGFTDVFAHFNDPGHEEKETLETGALAAAAGGYCRVLALPNTQPALHNKAQIQYVVQKSRTLPVQVLPMGAISKNCEGKDLAEMYDMQQAGAVAFTDGTLPVQNSQLMLKALQYVKAFEGVVVQIPDEQSLSRHGLMHEGLVSTRLGLPGKPALAETLLLARDIELLRYTQSRLHVTGISTAASVQLIRQAKQEGLQITASVAPYHLHFTHEALSSYNTNLKVTPPLRTPEDVAAIKQALAEGTVDCIASHHLPHEWDSKTCEFEYARYGMAGLETCLGALGAALPSLSPEQVVERMALAPAAIFGLPLPKLVVDESALLTLWQYGATWTAQADHLRGKSTNNAFIGQPLLHKPLGIVASNQYFVA